ncbi:hypothetical protein, partial [Microseira wollei]|uniref:hypothetical protein n=1 Tax=Microseira wollei TaxID=467598 RepID=UPI001CFE2343
YLCRAATGVRHLQFLHYAGFRGTASAIFGEKSKVIYAVPLQGEGICNFWREIKSYLCRAATGVRHLQFLHYAGFRGTASAIFGEK